MTWAVKSTKKGNPKRIAFDMNYNFIVVGFDSH